jgi:large subunit ribosomal protein L18
MLNQTKKLNKLRQNRAFRIRKRCQGSSTKPRLSVHKSNNHISAQLIDDETGVTIGMVGTFSKQFKGSEFAKKNKKSAEKIGQEIAKIAKSKNIDEVAFDRGPFKYHGILASIADAARAEGLKF